MMLYSHVKTVLISRFFPIFPYFSFFFPDAGFHVITDPILYDWTTIARSAFDNCFRSSGPITMTKKTNNTELVA